MISFRLYEPDCESCMYIIIRYLYALTPYVYPDRDRSIRANAASKRMIHLLDSLPTSAFVGARELKLRVPRRARIIVREGNNGEVGDKASHREARHACPIYSTSAGELSLGLFSATA